jgi:hypothetical protein
MGPEYLVIAITNDTNTQAQMPLKRIIQLRGATYTKTTSYWKPKELEHVSVLDRFCLTRLLLDEYNAQCILHMITIQTAGQKFKLHWY